MPTEPLPRSIASDPPQPGAWCTPDAIAGALDALRARAPRVHCITNQVVTGFTANTLLAAGAVPSMTTSPDEIAGFVAGADGLLVNLGTLDPERREAIGIALEARLPWVLDPVFIDRSPGRLAYAVELARRAPDIIRANLTEVAVLARALDANAAPADTSADQAAQPGVLSAHLGVVTAASGAIDRICHPGATALLDNGHAWLPLVTGSGCAASALVTAFAASGVRSELAAVCGIGLMALAGEHAAASTRGPGSFAAALLDAIYALRPEQLGAGLRLSFEPAAHVVQAGAARHERLR